MGRCVALTVMLVAVLLRLTPTVLLPFAVPLPGRSARWLHCAFGNAASRTCNR